MDKEDALYEPIFIGRRQLFSGIVSALRGEADLLHAPPESGFLQTISEATQPIDEPTRRSLVGRIGAVLLSPPALAGAAGIAGSAAFNLITDGRNREAEREAALWFVRPTFALELARRDFVSAAATSLNPETLGEIALLQSYRLHAEGSFQLLADNLEGLRAAAQHNEELSRTVLLARLGLDAQILGNGDEAEAAISQMKVQSIPDLEARVSLADALSSVTLNLVSGAKFIRLEGVDTKALVEAWAAPGIDVLDEDFRRLADQIGIGLNTVVQVRNLHRLRGVTDETARSRFRAEWLLETIEAWRVLRATPSTAEKADMDFIASLHRLALHAKLSGDRGQLGDILKLYFEGNGTDYSNGIEPARRVVLKNLRPNTVWMVLIRAADALEVGNLELARENLLTAVSRLSAIKNPTLLAAIPEFARRLGIGREDLERTHGSFRWSLVNPRRAQRAYYTAVVG